MRSYHLVRIEFPPENSPTILQAARISASAGWARSCLFPPRFTSANQRNKIVLQDTIGIARSAAGRLLIHVNLIVRISLYDAIHMSRMIKKKKTTAVQLFFRVRGMYRVLLTPARAVGLISPIAKTISLSLSLLCTRHLSHLFSRPSRY